MKEDFLIVLDVKQGDAILLKSKDQVILIDTGGSYYYDYSDNIVNYLKSLGIRKIDYLFLTHGDYDHLGSSYSLLEKIPILRVYFNNNEYNENEVKLINKLEDKNIYYQRINYQEDFIINNFYIKAISYNLKEENDASIIMMINNRINILLMGDASITTEKLLIDDYELLNFPIIKLGHHGSNTSTSFNLLEQINPKISLISVGKNNFYHHPSNEVLQRIQNTQIYQTSINGSIKINLNKNITISTNAP